jgi:hypothetical protein
MTGVEGETLPPPRVCSVAVMLAVASPKSSNTAFPSASSITFAGFTSPCRTGGSRPCRYTSAEAMSTHHFSLAGTE